MNIKSAECIAIVWIVPSGNELKSLINGLKKKRDICQPTRKYIVRVMSHLYL